MIKFSIVLVLVAVSAFLVTTAAAPHMGKLTLLVFDRFDDRAGREILFIGNSRTFYNDLPFMVRAIADSAGSQEKLEINVLAFEGEVLNKAGRTQAFSMLSPSRGKRSCCSPKAERRAAKAREPAFSAMPRPLQGK